MSKPTRLKEKPPIGDKPIEISNEEVWSTLSFLSSPCLFGRDKDKDIEMGEIVKLLLRQGTKRKHLQSLKKGKKGREPKIRVIKPKPMPKSTKASTLSPFISLEQHLQEALKA